MATYVEQQDRELKKLLDSMREALVRITPTSPDKKQQIVQVEMIAQQIRSTREAFSLELRSLGDEEARSYKVLLDDKMKQFRSLCNELEWKKSEMTREQFTKGGELVSAFFAFLGE
jgi:hypothetical protein